MGSAAGWRGGGEVGLADGEKVGLEGEDVGVLLEGGLVGWEGCSGQGRGYYSVGFFEEFIVGGGAGNGVPIATGIVSLKELVEGGCEIGHWSCLRTAVK